MSKFARLFNNINRPFYYIVLVVSLIFISPVIAKKSKDQLANQKYAQLTFKPMDLNVTRDLFRYESDIYHLIKVNNKKGRTQVGREVHCEKFISSIKYLGTFKKSNEASAVINIENLKTIKVKVGETITNTVFMIKEVNEEYFTLSNAKGSVCKVNKIRY